MNKLQKDNVFGEFIQKTTEIIEKENSGFLNELERELRKLIQIKS